MRAHVIKNGVVVNTIMVKSLDFMPGLIEATEGGKGWSYESGVFTLPEPKPVEPDPVETAKKALAQIKADQGDKPLSMAYLDKKLTEIEKILGV